MDQAPIGQTFELVRINVLRFLFLMMLPLMLFARPVWMDRAWIFTTLELVGTLLLVAAVLGRFWATLYIGGRKDEEVMQDGPYSMCRHPLYFFSTLGVIGLGLMLGSVILALLIGGIAFIILSATAASEESRLRGKFAADYANYAHCVPRIIPDARLFRTEPQVTVIIRHLKFNLLDAVVFLSFIPLTRALTLMKEYGIFSTFPIF